MAAAVESHGQTVFHLTGNRSGEDLAPVDSATVRPALLAGYRDLARLRYDFPVVLVDGPADGAFVRSLTSLVDEVLQEIAPRGSEGERLRRHVLRLEHDIRTLVGDGAHGLLTDLWDRAALDLAQGDESVGQILAHTGTRLPVDGEIADCDRGLPARLVEHAWRGVQQQKAKRFHEEVNRLIQALSDILRAAFIHSEGGSRPESLRAALGDPHHDQFDFEAMSRLLGRGAPEDELPAGRRERIEWALRVLRAPGPSYDYRYDSCADAVEAFRARLPELVELVKALSIAELEAQGRYVESEHDAFFAGFDENALTPDDLALFPDYLVCMDTGHAGAAQGSLVLDVLASDLPVKVLVETEDVLDESPLGAGHFGFGLHSAQLASTALGLHDAFILQTTSSNLYQLRARVLDGLRYPGPALFSVFSGSATPASELPPYLTAAAALESRAFPTFTYDPAAGPDWASRFSLEGNPQPELDWPIAELEYADAGLQRANEQVAFTIVDFMVCDRRFAQRFARIPDGNADTIPVDEWLSPDPKDVGERVPHVHVVDEDDRLHRLIADAKALQAAHRCREIWHGLQELGGIHNSHAERLLARERAAWEEQRQREPDGPRAEATSLVEAPPEAPAEVAEPAPGAAEEEIAEERSSDEPWIETARCSTCNECTAINDRMFVYNENKQADIKDPDAGTFRELVEAAEACQVAIIHPGKPRNPNEAGLEELLERASAFQ